MDPSTPKSLGKAPDIFSSETEVKIATSLGIFLVSLFAVSFPPLSKRLKYLRIPSIVFFLGKHFGTGVILSTAFVHLLPDAFRSLNSKWTGLIVLISLLAIFLVEYVSTAYVDYLHSYSSPPQSPTPSVHERSRSASRSSSTARDEESPLLNKSSPDPNITTTVVPTEATPLLLSQPGADTEEATALLVDAEPIEDIFGRSHHRFETRHAHETHSSSVSGKRISAVALFDEDGRMYGSGDVVGKVAVAPVQGGSSKKREPSHAHSHGHGAHGHTHAHFHGDMEAWHASDEEAHAHDEELPSEEVRVGRRRQIVGILMLQLGIMLHSLVIGLTLSITQGPEFATLVTAILFHQLFEGLSLGVRIAALPSTPSQGAFARMPGHTLKPLLAAAFALTTPAGIAIGLGAFAEHGAAERVRRIQGVMSAASAGMLVYAACVEMLAGDFVMDAMMWRSGLRRQALALCALFTGVCAMSFIGD
ncbi:ZIP zinc/iron transport family protein [Phanerochaete sordida]|uniref:ZIP zinc/iron transport family protein n=1 Tax=Phanerochaete sordida TaxID=48140 RepID=A0A9P3GH95_9APHY|nr:ZIP zinc/iron transport family protein [Phanerochaete sordida]